MLRPSRVELIEKLKKTANLGIGLAETPGYLSREQIMELTVLIEELKQRPDNRIEAGPTA